MPMNSDPAVVRLRLSASQMSVIGPGLDTIVKSYHSRRNGKDPLFSYPFRLFPPPPGFNRGAFDAYMMEQIVDLWKRLRPLKRVGGRTHMNAFEVRAAILAARVNSDWWRYKTKVDQKRRPRARELMSVEKAALDELQKKALRTIRSLERHMKRANYRLLALTKQADYAAQMKTWKAHVRWIRLRLVYFRPLGSKVEGKKTFYQAVLNDLVEIAKEGILAQGYELPEERELRRVMRLYARSSRRGREMAYPIAVVLRLGKHSMARSYLAEFVLNRLDLKEAWPA